jgi:hypothetical protein
LAEEIIDALEKDDREKDRAHFCGIVRIAAEV